MQKDAYETDQTSNDIWGRNVGYNEATRKWDSGKRDENAKVDVRSDTQRQDLERALTRDNERGFQEDHVMRRDSEFHDDDSPTIS